MNLKKWWHYPKYPAMTLILMRTWKAVMMMRMTGRAYKLYPGLKACHAEENECFFSTHYFWMKDDAYTIKTWLYYRNIKSFTFCISMLTLCWLNWTIVILFSHIYWDEHRVPVHIEPEFLLLIIGSSWRRQKSCGRMAGWISWILCWSSPPRG